MFVAAVIFGSMLAFILLAMLVNRVGWEGVLCFVACWGGGVAGLLYLLN